VLEGSLKNPQYVFAWPPSLAGRRCEMTMNPCIDDLQEACWSILYTGLDLPAFEVWRDQALECLGSLLGPDHLYAKSFSKYVAEACEMSLLIGGGILAAAKEEIRKIGSS